MPEPTDAPAAVDPQTPATPEAAPATAPAAAEPPKPTAPAAKPEATTPEAQEPAEPKPDDLPAWAREAITKANAEAAKYRTAAKAAADEAKNELAQSIGKALGLVKDDEPADPAKLTEQLTQSQTATKAAQLENAILRAAVAAKADPEALLDSRSFMERAAQTDPTDTAAIAALIGEATTGNPRFKTPPAGAPAGAADLGPGGQTPARTYTKAQLNDHAFYMANRADIQAAAREGRIRE